MSVRILTGALLGMLSDLIQTADRGDEAGIMGGITLHTSRGGFGDQPGLSDLLAGVSSDRYVVGHTYFWCTGQLSAPTWWSIQNARNVLSVFKAARGKDPQNTHAVELERMGNGEILIREDPNLIDEGVSLSFSEGDVSEYPAPTLYRLLDEKLPPTLIRDGKFVDPVPRTQVIAQVVVPFTKVALRRREIIRLYRTHQDARVLVQIGESYRGLLMPYRAVDLTGDVDHPDADVHAPDLSDPIWRRPRPASDSPDADDAQLLDLGLDLGDVDEGQGDEGPTDEVPE